MATVTAGNNYSQAIAADQTVAISINHNNSGRIRFVPANLESPSVEAGFGASFGPLSFSKTFGPWGVPGTVTVFCDVGTVTYTLGVSAFSNINVTGGAINNAAIGQTTPAAVKTSNLAATLTDSSATPGNVTNNTPRGRAAFAIGGSAVTVTSSLVTAASTVLVTLETVDTTLTEIRTVVPAAGSFTVTGNAAATGVTKFSWLVVN